MKYILHILFVVVTLVSCQSSSRPPLPEGCYQMRIKQDTATISINSRGDTVSGNLSYHRHEKDNNDGTFKGIIKNDSIIVADYTFQSEGISSVRQIVFKIKKDTLLQGYGELQMRNDTSVFRSVDLVIFDTKNPFVKGCQ